MRQAISRADRSRVELFRFVGPRVWGRVCGLLSAESMRLKKRHARNDTPDVLPCHDRRGGGRSFRSKGRQRIVRICRRETGRDDAKMVSMTWAAQHRMTRRKRWAQASRRWGLRCRRSITHRRTNPVCEDCSSRCTSRGRLMRSTSRSGIVRPASSTRGGLGIADSLESGTRTYQCRKTTLTKRPDPFDDIQSTGK